MKISRRAITPTPYFVLIGVSALVVLLSSAAAFGGVLPQQTRKKIVEEVLQNGFWGRARLPDGALVQPSREEDRSVTPLTEQQADRVIDAGELTAIGMWCALDWKPFYLDFTRSLRMEGLTEIQVAFAGVLHGASQATVLKALQTGGQCGDQVRESTRQRLQIQSPTSPRKGNAALHVIHEFVG
jgi:hypothetical protein